MLLQRLYGILRAGGSEAARGWRKGRYTGTIEVYRKKEDEGEQLSHSSATILSNNRDMRFSTYAVSSILSAT